MRALLKTIIGIIVIFILGGAIFGFLAWSRVPDMISSHLSKTLKVDVDIRDIHFGWNQFTIDQFEIGNPKGFSLSKAFAVEEISIEAPLPAYLKEDIVIESITLDNVYIGLEFDSPKSAKGNWTALMANAKQAQDESSHESQKTVFIKTITLNNISTDLLYRSAGKVRHLPKIPQIVLRNVSSKGGNLSDQLMHTALGQMIKEIFIKENLKDVMDQIFNLPGNSVKDVLGPIKGFFNANDNSLIFPDSKHILMT